MRRCFHVCNNSPRRSLLPGDYGEVTRHDAVKILGPHFDGQAVVDAIVADLIEKIPRLAAAEGTVQTGIVLFDQVIDGLLLVFAVQALGDDFEQR